MSLSDRFKSMLGKADDHSPKKGNVPPPAAATPTPPTPAPETKTPAAPSPTVEEVTRLIQDEKQAGEGHLQAIDKEIQAVRSALEKVEAQSNSRRENQAQTLAFLQQDAEREIKFLERKLQEDLSAWNRQISEREKTLQQVVRQSEAGQVEKKEAYAQMEEAQREKMQRADQLLKEQEARLLEERQKWRQLFQKKEEDILSVRQELSRREADLQAELAQQEGQRKAAQELWQARIKELERQWTEKRAEWETALKNKESERLRLHATFQEKQTAWQLEQERRLQDMTKREERATEKLGALKTHLLKETQSWQELTTTREDQLQQLKVKLILSESDSKGRLDQAQKLLQESVAGLMTNVQTLQQQFVAEQTAWTQQLDEKEAQLAHLQEDMRGKMRALEADFSQRMGTLNVEKDALGRQIETLQEDHRAAQAKYEMRQKQLREEQAALEAAHQQRLAEELQRAANDQAALQTQISTLEKQKEEAEREVAGITVRGKEELAKREALLKEAQTSFAGQDAELRQRFSQEEETLTRQTGSLNARLRSIERELQKLNESAERSEIDHRNTVDLLEKDHTEKQAAQQKRAQEQEALLRKRLEERRLALDQFLFTKKEQETRVQTQLMAKEKERQQVIAQLEQLPKTLAIALTAKKEAAQKEIVALKDRLLQEETALKEVREEAKAELQARATQLTGLRQTLEQREKETAAGLRSHEQIFETERAAIEKEVTLAQADTERVRTHWQGEIEKKEKEIVSVKDALQQKIVEQKNTLAQEELRLAQELAPFEVQRQAFTQTLESERTEHEKVLRTYEANIIAAQAQAQAAVEKAASQKAVRAAQFQEERSAGKNKIEALQQERERTVSMGKADLAEKSRFLQDLQEEQIQTTAAYELKHRELLKTGTLKAQQLQEQLEQAETELKAAREQLPLDLKQKEESLADLNKQLADQEAQHAQRMARLDRALATLARRGKAKEDVLRSALQKAKEDWAVKVAAKDAEIAALQSNLLAQETERQGELDRLAKQFAEERFKLEKSKEDLEWKLKDQKEVAERQLAGRRKEVQFLEAEIQRAKTQRDQDLAAKQSVFETEKNKIQAGITALQTQTEEDRRKQEQALNSREEEMQTLLIRSKERLRVLGEEFNQKVGLWKSTNEALRAQIEQTKGSLAQAQDHWEVLQKEKAAEINGLRQDLAAWEARILSDAQALERVHDQDVQVLTAQIRRQENELEELRAHFAHQLADKDEALRQAQEDIQHKEASSELEWQASLDQWQKDKQALQQEKSRFEKELQDLKRRTDAKEQEAEEAATRLRMDIVFKENEIERQRERLSAMREKDTTPLQDRLTQVTKKFEEEKRIAEAALRRKEDDIRALTSRLSMREKRLQDEMHRRAKEIDGLKSQVADEEASVRAHFGAESARLERLQKDQEAALDRLMEKERQVEQKKVQVDAQIHETLRQERQDLEQSLRLLESERLELQREWQALLGERENKIQLLSESLEERDRAMEELRSQSRQLADSLRKRTEVLRQAQHKTSRSGASNVGAWTAFEQGVQQYQQQAWEAAARSFEQCLARDPRWGAAYQYLALSYHAQGDEVRALQVAERALREDPSNTELGNWIDRLRSSIQTQKKAS